MTVTSHHCFAPQLLNTKNISMECILETSPKYLASGLRSWSEALLTIQDDSEIKLRSSDTPLLSPGRLVKSVQHMKPSTRGCTSSLLLFFHYYITHIYLPKKHERKNCEQVNLLDKLFRRPAQFFYHCKRMCSPVRFEPIHLLWNCTLSLLILVILVLSTWTFSFPPPYIIK